MENTKKAEVKPQRVNSNQHFYQHYDFTKKFGDDAIISEAVDLNDSMNIDVLIRELQSKKEKGFNHVAIDTTGNKFSILTNTLEFYKIKSDLLELYINEKQQEFLDNLYDSYLALSDPESKIYNKVVVPESVVQEIWSNLNDPNSGFILNKKMTDFKIKWDWDYRHEDGTLKTLKHEAFLVGYDINVLTEFEELRCSLDFKDQYNNIITLDYTEDLKTGEVFCSNSFFDFGNFYTVTAIKNSK